MSLFFRIFALTLRKRWYLLLFLLLPMLLLPVSQKLARPETAPVQVGVCLPKEGGDAFWQALSQHSGQVVEFIRTDEADLRRQVAGGRWDCGLLLAEDFALRLQEGDTDRCIRLLLGPASAAYPLVRETAAACLLRVYAPNIAASVLAELGARSPDDWFTPEPVDIQTQTLSGAPLQPLSLAGDTARRLIAGLVAALLTVFSLCAALDAGHWLQNGAAQRISALRSAAAVALPRLTALYLPAVTACILSLWVLGAAQFGLWLLPYSVFLLAVSLFAALRPRLLPAIPALLPFVPVCCVLLSPVLTEAILPLPELLRFLPMSLYLAACDGSPAAAPVLLSAGALLMALATLRDCAKRP